MNAEQSPQNSARPTAAVPGHAEHGANCSALDWINDYVGVPYVENGRTRAGWDCWGLVLAVYRDQLGVDLPDFTWRPPFGWTDKMAAFAAAWDQVAGRTVELDGPEPFALALVHHARRPYHVGIATGAGILHAARVGTVCEPLHRFAVYNPGITWLTLR